MTAQEAPPALAESGLAGDAAVDEEASGRSADGAVTGIAAAGEIDGRIPPNC